MPDAIPIKMNENVPLKLVASTQIPINGNEPSSLQRVIEKEISGANSKVASLKRASLSVALENGRPIVGILCKNEVKISAVWKKLKLIRLFRAPKKIVLHYGFIHFWNPFGSTEQISEKPLMLNQSDRDVGKIIKYRVLLNSDASFISLSPNGKYFVYSCAQELLHKTKKMVKSVKVLFLIDVQSKKVIFRVSGAPQLWNTQDVVCWSQDSEIVGINVTQICSSGNDAIIVVLPKFSPVESSTCTNTKPHQIFKGQILHIERLESSEHRAYVYKSANSTLSIHSIKDEKFIVEPLYIVPLINSTDTAVNDSLVQPVAITLDTFDRCIFVWARKRFQPGLASCDHVVITLPESALPPPPSKPGSNSNNNLQNEQVEKREQNEEADEHSSGWFSLGARACLSPNVLTLAANVPDSAPFALPCPIHRYSTPFVAECTATPATSPVSCSEFGSGHDPVSGPNYQTNSEVKVRAIGNCMRVFSPPSLRRLAVRAMYSMPGMLEILVHEGFLPTALMGTQFKCNSFNLGPIEPVSI